MAITTRVPSELVDVMLNVFASLVSSDVDRNPGSVIRSVFEGSSLLDAEQLVQAYKAVNSYYVDTASGDDLDRRVYGVVTRIQPAQATCTAIIGDPSVATAYSTALTSAAAIGATSLAVTSTSGWPTSGFIILDRGSAVYRERIAYSSIGSTSITCSATTLLHAIGAAVNVSQQGSDRVCPVGMKMVIPATAITNPIYFSLTSPAVVYDGDNQSAATPASSDLAGSAMNILANRLTQLPSAPFQNAFIVSSTAALGGRDLETDEELRSRYKARQAALAASTLNGLTNGVLGVTSGSTIVTSSWLVDSVGTPGLSTLYIDDGSAAGITKQAVPVSGSVPVGTYEVLLSPTTTKAGDSRGRFANAPVIEAHVYLSVTRGGTATVNGNVLTQAAAGWGVNDYNSGHYVVVDSNNKVWPVVSNTATQLTLSASSTPAPGPFAVFNVTNATKETFPGTNWALNASTGEFIYLGNGGAGFANNYESVLTIYPSDAIAGHQFAYSYYGGIVGEVQHVVNGDANDLANFPGLKAKGTWVTVDVPSIVSVAFTISVVPTATSTLTALTPIVVQTVTQAVNSLGVNVPVLLNPILVAILGIPGVSNATITIPSGNVSVSATQIAKAGAITVS